MEAAIKDAEFFALAAFLACTVLAGIRMFRDVLPRLNEEEQQHFRESLSGLGTRSFDRAVHRLWSEHYRLFPKSPLRLLFAVLLVGMCLSAMAYPLMPVLASR
jgi:hypothetical protein